MFRLIRAALMLVLLVAGVYFAVTVPLGEKTLWQHVRAIAGTQESQDLVDGVKTKAGEVIEQQLEPSTDGSPSEDAISEEDRKGLRKLIRERLHAKAAQGS